jgi:hypothetical protein
MSSGQTENQKLCFMACTRNGLKETAGIWATRQAGS